MEITLALGGGGVKGNAHIGVLKVLERKGFRVRGIAGTSAGGLWGSFYAAGYSLSEIESRMAKVNYASLFNRRPGDGPAMMGLGGMCQLLQDTLGDRTFNDMSMPFAVTAVDMQTAQQVILRQGKVCEAIQATIAVPGVFPPKVWEGRFLIDGGVLDPVPVALARSLAPRLPVVAVVLSPPTAEWINPPQPRLLAHIPLLSGYVSKLRLSQALNIFLRSVDIGGAMLTELRLQIDQPEVVIRPAVRHIGLLDSVNIPEVVRLGEEAAERALPELRRAVSWRSGLTRRFKTKKI